MGMARAVRVGTCCGLLAALGGCGGSKAPYEGREVAELERMLTDPDPTVRAQGAYGLARKGPEAAGAVPALVTALAGKEDLVREAAAQALGEIGPGAEAAVPALTEALKRPPWTVQRHAAIALGRVGPGAKAAVPTLETLTNNEHRPLREAARAAVKQIRGN